MPHLPCPATPEFVGVAGFFCCRITLPLWYPVEGLPPAALAHPAPGERTISNAAVACDG